LIVQGPKGGFTLCFDLEDQVKMSRVVGQRIRLVSESTKGTRVWCVEEFKIFRLLHHGKNLRKVKE